jgi:lipoyl(octanoyl) transferase
LQIVEFKHFGLTSYEQILLSMQNTVPDIVKDIAPQQVWFLEHESVYSKGTSAKEDELLSPIFPVVETGRGGKYTYHGPGQLICYVMIRLQDKDIKKYVHNLSGWIIAVLKEIGVHAFLDENYVGIWVMHNGASKKNCSHWYSCYKMGNMAWF